MLRFGRSQELFSSFSSICKKFTRSLVTNLNTMTETSETSQDSSQAEKRPLENESNSEAKKQKTEDTQATSTASVRIKKRNYAMMLGYLGKDYYGMQRNPKMKTIEEELIAAMYKVNLIGSDGFDILQNIHFQRAARTDKGVSAVRQVVSLKLPENPSKDSINENLPKDIRVFAIKRVTKGFNSKTKCNARTYSYTLPTFAFAHERETLKKSVTPEELEERMKQLSIIDGKPCQEFRLPKEELQRVSEILSKYKGTKNFHNYTTKILPLDPRAKRFIMDFTVEEPFIVDGMEFITLKVRGQSFMMHQIRKMVSMVIGIMRNIVTMETFQQTFDKPKFIISRAPSLGLMLNIVHYDFYNQKYGKDGFHETLEWADCEEEIKDFEKNHILKHVFDSEINEKSMLRWLADLDPFSYGLWDETKIEFKEEREYAACDD